MGKFNEYTQKATPADNDTLMIYDEASKANKLSPFSGIWNWIVEKLTNAVINNLQTSNKSVIGAINELNSKQQNKDVDYYDGDQTVTPKVEKQELATRQKFLTEDVKIKEIPFFEVSNNEGGQTVFIGKEL